MLPILFTAFFAFQNTQRPVSVVLLTGPSGKSPLVSQEQIEELSKSENGLHDNSSVGIIALKNDNRLYLFDKESTGLATLIEITKFYQESASTLNDGELNQSIWNISLKEINPLVASYVVNFGANGQFDQISNLSIEPRVILGGRNSKGEKIQYESDMKSSFKPSSELFPWSRTDISNVDSKFVVFPQVKLTVNPIGFQSSTTDVADQMTRCITFYWQFFEDYKILYNQAYDRFFEALTKRTNKDLQTSLSWEDQSLSSVLKQLANQGKTFPFHLVSQEGMSANEEDFKIRSANSSVVIYFTVQSAGQDPYVKGIVLPGKLP